jgi:tetratricopeptide (TPR) repeat protein
MAETSRKPALIELLEEACAEEHAFWNGLSEAERAARGTPDHWSAKDVMAHVTVWNDRLAADLEAAARGVAPPERISDFDEANREIFEANRERSWEELLAYEEQVFARLVASVEALTEETLDDPERFAWTGGRPLWWRISFTGFFHPMDHLSKLYLDRGESDLAQQIEERIAQAMGRLDTSESWQGTVIYNLACFYALNGQPGPALERLRRAFELNPDLVAWSKEDSDLDSLRDLPNYQAL